MKTEKQSADAALHFFFWVTGSVAFGFWKHSFSAAWWMACVLVGILNIGYAIEYGQKS